MFVYVNNKGEFCISTRKMDTRKVDWKFVRRMNVTLVCFDDHTLVISKNKVTNVPGF